MINDPISDLLTRIRNAADARLREITVPDSKLRKAVCDVLVKEGYLSEVKKDGNNLVASLVYKRRSPTITGVKNVSRPGLRIYRGAKELPRPYGGAGIAIISTSQGVMSDKEARKKNIGGQVLGEVW